MFQFGGVVQAPPRDLLEEALKENRQLKMQNHRLEQNFRGYERRYEEEVKKNKKLQMEVDTLLKKNFDLRTAVNNLTAITLASANPDARHMYEASWGRIAEAKNAKEQQEQQGMAPTSATPAHPPALGEKRKRSSSMYD